jgi:hypothetical protein
MSRPRRGSREVVSAQVEGVELLGQRDDGQFEYQAIAQFWDIPNDRLMIFRRGSFARSISHWKSSGKSFPVKINDAHIRTSQTTVGSVVDARETDEGVWYRGVLSSTAEDLYTKLVERHVEENSVEIYVLEEDTTRVPLEDAPAGAWIWEESKGDGTVSAREILQVSWVGIALLPSSAQDVPAIIGLSQALPHQGLPVADPATDWDAEAAAARVAEWAGTVQRKDRKHIPAWSSLAAAYLARGPITDGSETFLAQIADVMDGRLVVVPRALDIAVEELAASGLPAPDRRAAMRSIAEYRAAVRPLSGKVAFTPCAPQKSVLQSTADAGSLPGPASDTETPPTTVTATEGPDERMLELRRRGIDLLSTRIEHVATRLPEALHVTDDPGQGPVRAGRQGLRGASG